MKPETVNQDRVADTLVSDGLAVAVDGELRLP